jgi:hypothetical protein
MKYSCPLAYLFAVSLCATMPVSAKTQDNYGPGGYVPSFWDFGETSDLLFNVRIGTVFRFQGEDGSQLDSVALPTTYVSGQPFFEIRLEHRNSGDVLASSLMGSWNASAGTFGNFEFTLNRSIANSCVAGSIGDGCFNSVGLVHGEEYVLWAGIAEPGMPSATNSWGWHITGEPGSVAERLMSVNGAPPYSMFGGATAYRITYTPPIPEPHPALLMLIGMPLLARINRKKSVEPR